MSEKVVDLFKSKARLPRGVRQPGSPDDDRPQQGDGSGEPSTIGSEHHLWMGLQPIAFARPKYDGRSKRFFGAPRYEKFKRALRAELVPDHEPYEHPCDVEVVLGMGPPGQKPKWRWRAFLAGLWRHTSKPDVDNLAKAVLDAMNGVLWKDDSQVFRLVTEKVYTEEPFVRLTVVWRRQAAKGDV